MATTKNLLITTGELMLAAVLAVLDAGAQCSVFSHNYGGRPWPGSSIGVLAGEGVSKADIVDAIAIWERGCDALYAAGRIPLLLANYPGARMVRVDLDAKVSPVSGVCGTFNAASIRIWRFTIRAGKVQSCGPVARLIAHELGHVLGLGDAPELRQCCNHIMSPIWPDRLLIDRALPGECEIVAAANVPGLGLERGASEVVAAGLAGDAGLTTAVAVADATLAPEVATVARADAVPTRAGEGGSRLAHFLDRRTAMRRGALASRTVR
jgi:hypothetical protein